MRIFYPLLPLLLLHLGVFFAHLHLFFGGGGKKSRFIQSPGILGGWQPPVQRLLLHQFTLFRYLEYLLSSVIFVVFCSYILPTFLVFSFNPLIGCFKKQTVSINSNLLLTLNLVS